MSLELTRAALRLVADWQDLPENERVMFATAIAGRAAEWRDPKRELPKVWPMVLRIERDPQV